MLRRLRRSRASWLARLVLATLTLTASIFLVSVAAASAFKFEETYGFRNVSPGGYIQSAGAHTFKSNSGVATNGNPYMACQLFNGNSNVVAHGNGSCDVGFAFTEYVWARVYNEGGSTYYFYGYAHTE
jgi:hypothetical protein